MPITKLSFPAVALITALGGAGAITLVQHDARAQTATTTPAPAASQVPAAHPHQKAFEPGRHLAGRVAYLKAELKITAQQEPAWDKVVQAMRDNVRQGRSAFDQNRASHGQAQTALTHLEMRQRFEALRAQNSEHFLAAFRPLYTQLSPDQKKSADELFASHRHSGHGRF